MASEKQLAANRRNAENSTGPRTEAGKAKVARNALRHGLRAEKVVTFDETGGDFQAFLAEQRAALEPADAIEEQLVERIAFCAWRLRRIYRLEAHIIDSWHTPASIDEEDWGIEESLDANPYEISTLSRYESAVDRSLNRAYVMLERRQARRRGEAVPAPIAVSVTGFRSVTRTKEAAARNEICRTKPISLEESADGAKNDAGLGGPMSEEPAAGTSVDAPDWSAIPAPVDDGATRHLLGAAMASIPLPATDGQRVDLAALRGRTIVYAYPRTGQPGIDNPPGWDLIPGARGCTPQSCSFRDHFAELKALGVEHLFGLSTQGPAYQREAAERLHLPFAILSDEQLRLTRAMNLPTFATSGMTLLKRFTLVVDDGIVNHVFYPVFPPDRSAADVIAWLSAAKRSRGSSPVGAAS